MSDGDREAVGDGDSLIEPVELLLAVCDIVRLSLGVCVWLEVASLESVELGVLEALGVGEIVKLGDCD